MTNEEIAKYIRASAMQVASVYGCSVIFDEQNNINKGRQQTLKSALLGLQKALKELEEEK